MGTYTVAVRELCEFTAKEGDLDLRFTPSPSTRQWLHSAVPATGLSCGFHTYVGSRAAWDRIIDDLPQFQGAFAWNANQDPPEWRSS